MVERHLHTHRDKDENHGTPQQSVWPFLELFKTPVKSLARFFGTGDATTSKSSDGNHRHRQQLEDEEVVVHSRRNAMHGRPSVLDQPPLKKRQADFGEDWQDKIGIQLGGHLRSPKMARLDRYSIFDTPYKYRSSASKPYYLHNMHGSMKSPLLAHPGASLRTPATSLRAFQVASPSEKTSTSKYNHPEQTEELRDLEAHAKNMLSKAIAISSATIGNFSNRNTRPFMKPTGLDLESYRRLLSTIDAKPYAVSPPPPTKRSFAIHSLGSNNVNKEALPPDTESILVEDSSPSVPFSHKTRADIDIGTTALNMKVKAILSKKSLESAQDIERQLEIDALHSKLDTLEISRIKGIDLFEDEEEEEEEEQPEELRIQPLTEEEEELYSTIMEGPEGKVVTSHKSARLSLAVRDMQSMLPGQWLTDENINFYMALLNDRNRRRLEKDQKPCCYFTNTFFFNKLYKDSGKYNYNGVKKWTRPAKLGGIKTTECDKIIVPIHQQVHWCTAVVDVQREELLYYDSMLGRDESVLESLAKWIEDEMKDKGGKSIDTSSWPRKYPREIPTQENHYDCGVFAMKFAEYSGLDALMTFTQEDMPLLRKRIVLQFLQTNLDNNSITPPNS